MLCAAVSDLRAHGRPLVGFAPTAKAARVLETGTGMGCDTVAKLVYEHTRPHRNETYIQTDKSHWKSYQT